MNEAVNHPIDPDLFENGRADGRIMKKPFLLLMKQHPHNWVIIAMSMNS